MRSRPVRSVPISKSNADTARPSPAPGGGVKTSASVRPRIARSDRLSSNSHSPLALRTSPSGSTTRMAIGNPAKSSAKLGESGSGAGSPGRIEIGQHRLDAIGVRLLVHRVAELGRAGQALGVPADMLAHHVDA